MNECTALSDRMIEVAHGRSRWTAAESAHLERCADCGAEWQLVRATAALGGSIRLDERAIAESVVARLRAVPPVSLASRRRRRVAPAIGLAAAVLLAVAVWRVVPRSPAAESTNFATELDGLDADELAIVLEAYPEPLGAVMPDGVVGMSDLDPEELEAVLDSFEG
ncbi:MAG: hypothetical protein AB7R55_24050 [Gemmatimonadales bacterium]